jgi:hypothetical protein
MSKLHKPRNIGHIPKIPCAICGRASVISYRIKGKDIPICAKCRKEAIAS